MKYKYAHLYSYKVYNTLKLATYLAWNLQMIDSTKFTINSSWTSNHKIIRAIIKQHQLVQFSPPFVLEREKGRKKFVQKPEDKLTIETNSEPIKKRTFKYTNDALKLNI